MLIPGVSGGTMAMILGEYDRLLGAVSSLRRQWKGSLWFLGLFAGGGILGMVLLARPLLYLLEQYPRPLLYFFMGGAAGSIPAIYEKAGVTRFSWRAVLYLALGIDGVLVFSLLPEHTWSFQRNLPGILALAGAGILAAVALVLPGISVTYMLLMLGVYEPVVQAIGRLELSILIPLGIGGILGILLTTKLLDMAMKRCPRASYLGILGFVLGSLMQVFPGLPVGREWILCVGMAVAGYGGIRSLEKWL